MPSSQDLCALDQFDIKLLAALEADGRLTNSELAEKVGLSASQCSRRRIRLEEAGIIEGYSARLNARRLGIGLLALIQVSMSPHSKENAKKFSDFVNAVEEIQEAYALTGDADYLLKVVVPDLKNLSRIINDLILPHASVSHVKSSIVLTTLKDTHRLPLTATKAHP
jgi:DNA-binding Lrp family transcriptional regulator